MIPPSAFRPMTLVPSLLAALTTWVTLLAWGGFAERPARFMVPILWACVLVALVGMLLRSARVPALLVVGAQLVAVLLWLQHRYAGGEALAGLLPTPTSVRAMLAVLGEAVDAAATYSSPVPRSVPEFYPLLVVAGSLTAVLVDLLAVGLRRAPLAGLPLLAVYTAPVSILDGGVSWLLFAAASMCFLFLIAAGESLRLSHWGRQLTPKVGLYDSRNSPVSHQAVWASARKIGFTATALAVVVPALIPSISGSWFDSGRNGGNGNGDGVTVTNPMVDLKRDLVRGADVDLVRVRTKDPDPSYLRISVLNTFDGTAWRPAGRDIPREQRADGPVARPPGLETKVATRRYKSTIEVSDFFTSRWLPTPYPVSAVYAPGDWRYDRSTMDFISAAANQTTAGLTYTVEALRLSPTASELADAIPAPLSVFTPNTDLPRSLPRSVGTLAREVTQGRATKFEQAVALQQWFREDGGFRYSLERPAGSGTQDLVSFLSTGKNGRVGFCEQFAAAMAVMGRTLGIPSRVAVGFLRADSTGPDTWTFSTHDLHAWPEMYFGGVGWVRFEPTPQGRTGAVPGYTTQSLPTVAPSSSSSAPSAAPSVNRVDKTTDGATPTTPGGSGPTLGHPLVLGGLGLLLGLLALALTPRVLRARVRRRRRTDEGTATDWVEAAWRELRDSAVDLGLAWDDHVTLRTAATRLEGAFGDPGEADDALTRGRRGRDVNPDAAAALHRLVGLLERARYARSLPPGAASHGEVLADADACIEALRAGAGRNRRSRAAWLPASVLSRTGSHHRRARHRGPVLGQPGVDRAL